MTLSGFEMKTYGQKKRVTPIFSCPCNTNGMHTIDWLVGENSSRLEEVENDCLVFTYQLPRKYVQVQGLLLESRQLQNGRSTKPVYLKSKKETPGNMKRQKNKGT
ncbi:uncharacterized protein LOC123535014 isoform X1 [Mercenaria mercenaria]|uniref:uncharacterized protein LOC123535014 isoform X1 n=1 Tax=Mercenaria mercenaria TaxID=6596 RepID=UPI00234EE2A4|nr:uncharacterized protein LOC123535014 isoform X1 [Mercenaria mercenaria]XP_053380372.1 uncharacterized protein LOC123535014 isoform X1 [Mercenaria mercenaria]XP_053380373.1 uncharacterized protein LOC123535014 isoform X1 [Mercenaria mercenaria]